MEFRYVWYLSETFTASDKAAVHKGLLPFLKKRNVSSHGDRPS